MSSGSGHHSMYTGCLHLLIDGDENYKQVAPNRGLKQGCPLRPLLYSLYNNDMDRFLTVQRGAATALDSVKIPHCDYADDIALTSNTAESLQFQLNKFVDYARFKGLNLNTDKTKVMVFFSRGNSAISTFTYLSVCSAGVPRGDRDRRHTSETCH